MDKRKITMLYIELGNLIKDMEDSGVAPQIIGRLEGILSIYDDWMYKIGIND